MKSLNEKIVFIFCSIMYTYSINGKELKYVIAIDADYNTYFIITKYDNVFDKYNWAYSVEDIIEAALGNEVRKKKITDAYDEVISNSTEFDLYNDDFIQMLYSDKKDSLLEKYNSLFVGTGEPMLTGPLSEKIITMYNLSDNKLNQIIDNTFTHEQILNNDNVNVIYNFAKSYRRNNYIEKYVELLKKG